MKILQTKSIAKNILIVNVFSFLQKFLLFVFSIIVSRHFGNEYYGMFSTANTFSIFMMVFIAFGSDFYLTRSISRDPNSTQNYFWNILFIRLIIYSVLLVIISLFFNYLPYKPELLQLIKIFAVYSIIKSINQQILYVYQGVERFDLQSVIMVTTSALLLLGAALIVYLGLSIYFIGYLYVFVQVLILIVNSLILYFNKIITFNIFSIISLKMLKKIFIASLPFMLSGVISMVYNRIDIVMLSLMRTNAEVGDYTVSYNLYEAFLFIPAAFGTVFFPRLVKYFKNNQPELVKKESSILIYHLLIIMLPIAIGTVFFSNNIINLIYGQQFIGASTSLRILIWGLIIHLFNNILGRILYGLNQEKYFVKISLYSMLTNVVINFLLIPHYGINGAAIATIVSFLVSFSMHYRRVALLMNFKFLINRKQVKKISLISITFFIMCFILFMSEINLYFIVLFLVLYYILLLFIFRAIDFNYIKLLFRIKSK